MKQYLTKQLIDFITKKAEDPIWKTPGLVSMFAKNWYDVIKVTSKGLIFFEGNSDTGFQHISDRHNYFSNKNYFNSDKNPSKFNRKLVPIKDYIDIADDIYWANNKDKAEHEFSAIFDKYIGESSRYTDAKTKSKFHLVLYKNTKIVHSLYPAKSLDKLKNAGEFARCRTQITVNRKFSENCFTAYIPYENDKHIIRYVIVLRFNNITGRCKLYIQVNYLN